MMNVRDKTCKNKNRFPEDWEKYEPYRNILILPQGSNSPLMRGLFPCKTILEKTVFDFCGREDLTWTIDELFSLGVMKDMTSLSSECHCMPMVKIEDGNIFENFKIVGIINLCMTEKYYDANIIKNMDVEYYNISIIGKGQKPEDKVFVTFKMSSYNNVYTLQDVEKFIRLVDDIHSRKNGIVVVHCTHGLNRTGFMFCLYLMLRLNVSPAASIELFKQCRGYDIEREELKTLLLKQDFSYLRNNI